MSGRLAELDSRYHRQMSLSIPGAAVLLSLTLLIYPQNYMIAPQMRVGQRGPLEVMPQVDLIPDETEDRHLTAAPSSGPRTDFQVVELDYANDPNREPMSIASPPPLEEIVDEAKIFSSVDDLQDAVQTTGHPVLARTDYEVVHMQRPIYPRQAVSRGIEGRVLVMMLVDINGHVSHAYVVNPDRYPLLERAATEAVYKSLFRPHLVDGVPTPFWIRVPFHFRLVS